jgi:Adenylosuccinate lyase (EC 4.3.2.2)
MIARYTRKPFKELWSEKRKFELWLKVELAVCRAWHKKGQNSHPSLTGDRKEGQGR